LIDDDDDDDEQFRKTLAADGVVIIIALSSGFRVSVNIITKEAIKTNNIRMGD
jgi:hypothetical protein